MEVNGGSDRVDRKEPGSGTTEGGRVGVRWWGRGAHSKFLFKEMN